MDLAGDRVHPEEVLGDNPLWAGFWNTGEEWHIGITDPGGVEWDIVCFDIADPDLAVHEAPHTLSDLTGWLETLEDRFSAQPDSGSFAAELIVVNGQYVIEIAAPGLPEATRLTTSIPFDAWVYGRPVR